jgi:hypothetical protein
MSMLAQVVFNAIVIGVYLSAFLAFLQGDKDLERALLRAANMSSTGIIALPENFSFESEFSEDCEDFTNTSSVINSDGRVLDF